MYSLDYEGINNRIKKAILESGLTRQEVAKRCYVDRSTLINWIYKGMLPRTDCLAYLCKGLGVSADWVLFGEEVK